MLTTGLVDMLVNKNLTSALLNITFELVFVDISLPRE